MYYADIVGAASILKKMEELGAEDPAYAPAEALRKIAENGTKFLDIDTGGLKTTRS
jgi:3-hydroxyacyl-CoA dehydrogenase